MLVCNTWFIRLKTTFHRRKTYLTGGKCDKENGTLECSPKLMTFLTSQSWGESTEEKQNFVKSVYLEAILKSSHKRKLWTRQLSKSPWFWMRMQYVTCLTTAEILYWLAFHLWVLYYQTNLRSCGLAKSLWGTLSFKVLNQDPTRMRWFLQEW